MKKKFKYIFLNNQWHKWTYVLCKFNFFLPRKQKTKINKKALFLPSNKRKSCLIKTYWYALLTHVVLIVGLSLWWHGPGRGVVIWILTVGILPSRVRSHPWLLLVVCRWWKRLLRWRIFPSTRILLLVAVRRITILK